MRKPSRDQLRIIQASIGQPMQVLASAGSGKTFVLTERVRYLLEHTRKDGVLALTFTNKAAEEMQLRLEGISDIENRCWISTVHAIAQRVLEKYGHTIGLPSELHIYEREQDRKAIFLQTLRDNGIDIDTYLNTGDKELRRDRESKIQERLKQFSIAKRELLNESDIKERFSKNSRFWPLFQAYQNTLIESGGIDFDDILVYAHRIFLEQPWCAQIYRSKYKHICVDEAQDLNRAQYEFIKAICGDELQSILMVGDPNQMIYGFNSSSHDYLCRFFVDDFAPLQYSLKENFRSSKAVIRLANRLKEGSQAISNFALEGRSEINAFEDEDKEADWVCEKIAELMEENSHPDIENRIMLDKMVVIARNQFVFDSLIKKLEEHKISYFIKNTGRYTKPSSTVGQILDLAICIRLNPKNWVDGKQLCSILNIASPTNWGESDLLISFAKTVQNRKNDFSDIYSNLLYKMAEIDLEEPNILKFCRDFKDLIENSMINISEETDDEIERTLKELQTLKKYWTSFKLKGLGESLSSFRNAMVMGKLSDKSNSYGIALSTLHAMKGLEKDIVFLIGMCEGVFPDYRAKNFQEIEEERNSAFVAVTRSRRWIYLSYPEQRMMPWGQIKKQSPSRFLLEMQQTS